MFLRQVIDYVKEEIKKLEFAKLTTKLNEHRETLLSLLVKIALLLEESNDSLKLDKVREVLFCLEAINVEEKRPSNFGFFNKIKTKTTREIIKSEGYPILLERSNDTTQAVKTVSIDEHRILAAIHIALMKCYLLIKWDYVYPEQSEDEINKILSEWQTHRIALSDSNAGYLDFRRGISIMHEFSNNEKDLKLKLQELIHKAHYYPSSEAEKLLEWLEKNGGQDNSRFITFLFANNYFVPGVWDDLKPALGISNEIVPLNWGIESGKICFKFDTAIRTIQYGSMANIVTDKDGKTDMVKGADEIGGILEATKTPPILLRAAGTVVLEIVADKVMPVIQSFTVQSFNDYIKHPITPDLRNENLLENKAVNREYKKNHT